MQGIPEYANQTALIITTDHGRGVTPTDWISHGASTEGAEYLWIATLAPGIVPGLGVREGVETTQSQVAATVAHLLGADFTAVAPRASRSLPGLIPVAP